VSLERREAVPSSHHRQQDKRRETEPPQGARHTILPASLPSQMRGEPLSFTPTRTRTRSPESMTSRLEVPSLATVRRVRGLPFSPNIWLAG